MAWCGRSVDSLPPRRALLVLPAEEAYRETNSSPDVMRRASRGTRTLLANAEPCHFRHREQWQWNASPASDASYRTAPHRQLPVNMPWTTAAGRPGQGVERRTRRQIDRGSRGRFSVTQGTAYDKRRTSSGSTTASLVVGRVPRAPVMRWAVQAARSSSRAARKWNRGGAHRQRARGLRVPGGVRWHRDACLSTERRSRQAQRAASRLERSAA